MKLIPRIYKLDRLPNEVARLVLPKSLNAIIIKTVVEGKGFSYTTKHYDDTKPMKVHLATYYRTLAVAMSLKSKYSLELPLTSQEKKIHVLEKIDFYSNRVEDFVKKIEESRPCFIRRVEDFAIYNEDRQIIDCTAIPSILESPTEAFKLDSCFRRHYIEFMLSKYPQSKPVLQKNRRIFISLISKFELPTGEKLLAKFDSLMVWRYLTKTGLTKTQLEKSAPWLYTLIADKTCRCPLCELFITKGCKECPLNCVDNAEVESTFYKYSFASELIVRQSEASKLVKELEEWKIEY